MDADDRLRHEIIEPNKKTVRERAQDLDNMQVDELILRDTEERGEK